MLLAQKQLAQRPPAYLDTLQKIYHTLCRVVMLLAQEQLAERPPAYLDTLQKIYDALSRVVMLLGEKLILSLCIVVFQQGFNLSIAHSSTRPVTRHDSSNIIFQLRNCTLDSAVTNCYLLYDVIVEISNEL